MNRRGFTLLEVLVASLIMAIAVAGLLSNLSTSLRNADRREHGLTERREGARGLDVPGRRALSGLRIDRKRAIVAAKRRDAAYDAAEERLADRERHLMIRVVTPTVDVARVERPSEDVKRHE